MTSKERFEAHVKSELGDIAVMDTGRYISPKIHNYWLTWQAAERDMLDRCIAAIEDENRQRKITVADVIDKLKELLNGQ